MRHLKSGRKLGRNASHRRAMMRNLVCALIEHERIETTDARAKELRRVIEPLITRARKNSSHDQRVAGRWVPDRGLLHKLFHEIGPRFSDRPGGYTRIVKVGSRLGDNAPISLIELVGYES